MEDPHLGTGPDEDTSEAFTSRDDLDSNSIFSDDSIFPDDKHEGGEGGTPTTLYQACARNEVLTLHWMLDRGVTHEEVMEVDINGWNGLMVAAYKGFVDIVSGLHSCPYLDINHQDNDGNTALMIAAQAGHITILNYILNYYMGADMEIRDSRGFTALIKAAIQGRSECVAALIMAGADVNAVDTQRGKCAREWAQKTGHFETLQKLRQLILQPCAEQFCESYVPEWPDLKHLVAKAMATKTRGERVSQHFRTTFSFSFPQDPQANGVLDHMVRMTTSIHSPLVVTGCRPLCPTSPPEVGKRRLAVPELVQQYSERELEEHCVPHRKSSITSPTPPNSFTASDIPRRSSTFSIVSSGVRGLIPLSTSRRSSVFPASCVPLIKVTKSAEPTPKKEKRKMSKAHLEPPKWKYKEAKEEKNREKKTAEEKQDSDKHDNKKVSKN
ncbi:ankyrin repeat domain-containing protein 33B-like [Arapaima gigas]